MVLSVNGEGSGCHCCGKSSVFLRHFQEKIISDVQNMLHNIKMEKISLQISIFFSYFAVGTNGGHRHRVTINFQIR